MPFFFNCKLCTALVSTLLLFASLSISAEELIIKLSSSLAGDQSATLLSQHNLEIVEKIESFNLCTVKVPTDINIDQLINSLKSDSRVEYVEKNMSTGQGDLLPNDVLIDEQWHHNTINSESAWDISRGSNNIIIAVLDSGLQIGNADLSGARFLSGFDFVNNDNDADDDLSHGTHVTGLIAANADNGISGAGIDHNAMILPVKVINENNIGSTFDLVQGINYAMSQGADVINMSLGGYSNSNALNEMLSSAKDNGSILISSAGNGGIGEADNNYPGASQHTISVGSTDIYNDRAFFSSTGKTLDVVAPGSAVKTTSYYEGNGAGLDYFNGTSAAAPMVSGIAGLAKALDPDLTQDEFLEILTLTSRDQVSSSYEDTPGRDDFFGWGLVDAPAVLERINPGLPVVPARIEAQSFTTSFDTTPGNLGDDICGTHDVDSQTTHDLDGQCNIAWTDSGEWLEYEIFVEQPGLYNVNLRLASPRGGSVLMLVDGTEVEQVSVSTGNWQNFKDYTIETQLSYGVNSIRVHFIDGNVNFNFLDVQLVAAAVPALIDALDFLASFDNSNGNNGDSVCEAGDVDAQLTLDNHGLCNVGWIESGEWLEYNLLVDQPGTYFINLRLAGGPGGEVSVDVDGIEVDRVLVSGNGWQNFSDHIVSTQLNQGINTIRVNFIDGGVNFNYLDIKTTSEIILTPTKDAYIQGGSLSNESFGALPNLVVKSNEHDDYTREAYLDFRIDQLAALNIQRATIRLYANRVDESLYISLHRIAVNNSAEADITWNNTPDETDEVAVTAVFSSAGPRYYEWDVTDYLTEKVGASTFSLLVKEGNTNDKIIEFNSREANSNRPQLVIVHGN